MRLRFLVLSILVPSALLADPAKLAPISGNNAPRLVAWSESQQRLWFTDEHFTPVTVGYTDADANVASTKAVPCAGCAEGTARVYIESIAADYEGAWIAYTRVAMDGSPLDGGMNSYIAHVDEDFDFQVFPVPEKDALRRYEFGQIGRSHIAVGPDQKIRFTMNAIGRFGTMTRDGQFTSKPFSSTFSSPSGLAYGPDGNYWAALGIGKIARITLGNAITEYTLPKVDGQTPVPTEIAAAPDGTLIANDLRGGLLRLLAETGDVAYQKATANCTPGKLVAGAPGELWTACSAQATGSIGHVFIDSQPTEKPFRYHLDMVPFDTTAPTYPFDLAWTGPSRYLTFATAYQFPQGGGPARDALYDTSHQPRCTLQTKIIDRKFGDPRELLPPFFSMTAFIGNRYRFTVEPSGGTPPYFVSLESDTPNDMTWDGTTLEGRLNVDEERFVPLTMKVVDSSQPACIQSIPFGLFARDAIPRRRAARH